MILYKKLQKGAEAPSRVIYVDSKDDPRFKAYNDSSNLYTYNDNLLKQIESRLPPEAPRSEQYPNNTYYGGLPSDPLIPNAEYSNENANESSGARAKNVSIRKVGTNVNYPYINYPVKYDYPIGDLQWRETDFSANRNAVTGEWNKPLKTITFGETGNGAISFGTTSGYKAGENATVGRYDFASDKFISEENVAEDENKFKKVFGPVKDSEFAMVSVYKKPEVQVIVKPPKFQMDASGTKHIITYNDGRKLEMSQLEFAEWLKDPKNMALFQEARKARYQIKQ